MLFYFTYAQISVFHYLLCLCSSLSPVSTRFSSSFFIVNYSFVVLPSMLLVSSSSVLSLASLSHSPTYPLACLFLPCHQSLSSPLRPFSTYLRYYSPLSLFLASLLFLPNLSSSPRILPLFLLPLFHQLSAE